MRTVIALICAVALFNSTSLAQNVSVVLGKHLGRVSPYAITGFNHGVYMRVIDLEKDFAALNIGSLRYPPGNLADEQPLSAMAITDYSRQWPFLGKPPVLVVTNLFSSTAAEAGRAALEFKGSGIPVLAFEVGNEHDLYASNRGDPSWTPAKYCRAFRTYRAAIKKISPGARVAGPAVSGAETAEAYLREVIRRCGDVLDVLTWHIYPTDGSAEDAQALASAAQVSGTIRRYRRWLRDPEMNPLGYARDIELGITEFGLSWRTNTYRHLSDTVATLWLADALGQMVRERLDMSHYFALQGTGGHGLIDEADWRRPTYYLFEMLRDYTGTTLAASSSDPLVKAYAVTAAKTTQILLINTSVEAKTVSLKLPDRLGRLELKTLSDKTYEVYVDKVAYTRSRQPAGKIVALPARALVLVTATP
jgi:hypothetical protein